MRKLIAGELKKTFLKPIIYVVSLILCASLIISLFIYNPDAKSFSTDSSSITSVTGTTLDTLKTNFIYKRSSLENEITAVKDNLISYYKDNNLTIDDVKIYLNQEESPNIISQFKNFTDVLNAGIAPYDNDYENYEYELQNYLNEIYNSAKDMETKYLELLNKEFPIILISKKSSDSIKNKLNELVKATSTPNSGLSESGYISIANYVNNKKLLPNLTTELSNVDDIVLSSENFLYPLFDAYFDEGLDEKQTPILSAINEENENKDNLQTLINQYYSNIHMAKFIVYNKVYAQIVGGLTDYAIQNLDGTEILNNKCQLSKNGTYLYAINENITLYTYLFTNNLYDFNFNFATNGTVLMSNSGRNAIDYALFSSQITSFFIIMFCILLGATSISSEYSLGTIKLIVTKPHSRNKIMSAKILSTLIFGLIFILFTLIASCSIGWIAFGMDSTKILAVFNAKNVFSIHPILYFLIYIVCLMIKLTIFCLLGVFISLIFKNNVPSLIIGFVIFFLGTMLANVLPPLAFISYLPLGNIDLFPFFGGVYSSINSSLSLQSLIFPPVFGNNSIIITGVYSASLIIILSLASHLIFAKRDVS